MKKQAKILALILSLCLIFGVIVATTAFADTTPAETNQLDKSYLEGITTSVPGHFTNGDTESKTESAVFGMGSVYSGPNPYARFLKAEKYDSIDPSRTNLYQEVRPYKATSNQYQYATRTFASGDLDYYVVDFDIAATQYLIYFKTPYFIERDGDEGTQTNNLTTNSHLGYVDSSDGTTDKAPANEYFTHALGTFEYDAQGNITKIHVDTVFFHEYTGLDANNSHKYHIRYLNKELAVANDYLNDRHSSQLNLEAYTFTIEDADVINNITYHLSYPGATGVWFPTNDAKLFLDIMKFDTYGQGGKYYIAGNVNTTAYLSNELNVWDHITIIVAYNEIDSTYYSGGYLLLNGELVNKWQNSGTAAYSQTNTGRAQLLVTRGNSKIYYNPASYTPANSLPASYSVAYDNWTVNTYSNEYNSDGFVGIDDYVKYLQTGTLPEGMSEIEYTDCVDVVYDADYVSPNAYAASVDGEPYYDINDAAANITQNAEVIITKDILDFTPAEGVTNFTVSLLDGAKFSLSDAAKATLYAEPNSDGDEYTVRPYGPQDVVEFDYYYGDEKIGEGAGNRLLGMVLDSSVILDRAAQDAYIITDRTNGKYLAIASDEVTWYWNMDEEGYYSADTFYPIDTELFDVDAITEDFGSNRLIVKGVVETEEKTATGYMIVDYVNGAEKVVTNAAGTYDYLSNTEFTTSASSLAAAFRTELTATANSGKTIVLTCANLLDVDGKTDLDNAESRLGGFDLFADTQGVGGVTISGDLILDLNGRTLITAWVSGTSINYSGRRMFTLGNNASATIYSSVAGGEIYQCYYSHTSTEWANSTTIPGGNPLQTESIFCLNAANVDLNLGYYKNPNTGAEADGDNLRISGGSIIYSEVNNDDADINVTLNGGYYYTPTRSYQGMFCIAADNLTLNINDADIVYNHMQFAMFTLNRYRESDPAKNIVINITNSNVLSTNAATGALHGIFNIRATTNETITVEDSTVLGTVNIAAKTVLNVGNGCVLSGTGWSNIAPITGLETTTGPDTAFSFKMPWNFAMKSTYAYVEGMTDTADLHVQNDGTVNYVREYQLINGTHYYMSDRYYEIIDKAYAVTAPIYTYDPNNMPETFVSVTYNYTNADNIPKSDVEYYIKGAAVSNPSVALQKSNGWYALGAGPDSWTLANGTVITENTVATPVESKLVPTAAVQAKYSVGTASYVKFTLYLPEYQDAAGNAIPLTEGVSDISVYKYNGTAKINPGAYVQVAADGTKMRSYVTGEMTPSNFNSATLGDFIIKFNVTIGGVTTPCEQRVELSTVQYATDILEQRNGTVNGKKDVMWGYAYLNYANTTFKAVTGNNIDGALELLTRYETETANWGTQETPDSVAIRWAAYEAEMDNKVETTNLDYSGLSGYVKGFAWVYSMEKPHLVAILDYSETTADYSLYDNYGAGSGATLKEGANLANRIYSFNFQGQGATFNGDVSYYYRTWNRFDGNKDTGYKYVYIWASAKGIDTLSADSFNIILYAYDENGEKDTDNAKNEVARGQYSMVEYIKWARAELGTEGTEVTQNDVDTAEAAYLLSLAFRDFKNYVPEN